MATNLYKAPLSRRWVLTSHSWNVWVLHGDFLWKTSVWKGGEKEALTVKKVTDTASAKWRMLTWSLLSHVESMDPWYDGRESDLET